MGLKPELTYATSINPPEDFSEDEVDSRYPNIPQESWRLQEDGEARRSSMVSTKPKTRRNRSLTTGRHSVGGAPSPRAFLAQTQGNPGEWVQVGLTRTLVVRKRRGLSRQIWRAYQESSISALVYYLQRTASSKLGVYANIKPQGATPRYEGSIKLYEGSDNPQDNESCSRTLDSSRPQLRAENLLTLVESFWAY
jgi:hypothetical protein